MSDALVEFLLAQIAEDEELLGYGVWSPGREYAHEEPARWRAECDAKRRIVEDFETLHADYRVTHDPRTEARRLQARIAMTHIAAIYADRPDFREEWRP